MSPKIELVSIRYQNVRGCYDTTLPLENDKTLIVGRNNAGKTSALLLLAWLINDADPGRLGCNEELNEQERNLLLPARSAQHRARRITLTVKIQDGRTARSFDADHNNNAMLRIGFHVSGTPTAFIQLGTAHTNSMESVWAVLKRGYYGTYHQWTTKHMRRYVDEFHVSPECRRRSVRHDRPDRVTVPRDGEKAVAVSGIDGAALVGQRGIISMWGRRGALNTGQRIKIKILLIRSALHQKPFLAI